MKTNKWLYIFIACVLIAVVCGGGLALRSCHIRKANEKMQELQQAVNTEAPAATETPVIPLATEAIMPTPAVLEEEPQSESFLLEELGIEVPNKQLDWDALHQESEDIYAWITVTGTTVDYPVLQHPTDDTYYLNYNLDGTKGFPGCIYTEKEYNSKDFSDRHTVIYGHNLKTGLMFSSLHNFDDPKMMEEDHYIFIYTEENELFIYKIFGAYEFPNLHLLANFDTENEYLYQQYLDLVKSSYGRIKNMRKDIEVTAKDRIVTLSTCTMDHDASLRFLVQGVLVYPQVSEEAQIGEGLSE